MSIYINGMINHGEYISLGESWCLYLKESGNYLLGDREVYVEYNANQYFIEPNTPVKKITRHSKVLTHYEDKHGNTISVEDRKKIYYKFYDWEDDYFNYPSLEDEFEHRKEQEALKEFEAVYHQPEDEYTDVELTCVGEAEDTGNPFIKTALSYGQARFSNSGFYQVDYSAFIASIFWKYIEEHDLKEFTTNSTHSNVVYAKVKGQYILSDKMFGTEANKTKTYTDLDKAKEDMAEAKRKLIRHLNVKIFGGDKPIKGVSAKEAHSVANNISNLLWKIDSKKSTISELRAARNKVAELIAKIESSMEE